MRYDLRRLDQLGVRFPYHPHHNVRHLAVKDAVLRCAGNEVLVLGCGRGLVEYLLPDGMTCVSIDADKVEIEAALEINRYRRNRHFHVGDIHECDQILANTKFPIVVISEVIEHLPDDRLALKVAGDHLLPGGMLVLTVPNRERFHNRVLKWMRRPAFRMSMDHLREYGYDDICELLGETSFVVRRWRGVWFDFPRPYEVERLISPYSRIRTCLAALAPRSATYLLLTCSASGVRDDVHRGLTEES